METVLWASYPCLCFNTAGSKPIEGGQAFWMTDLLLHWLMKGDAPQQQGCNPGGLFPQLLSRGSPRPRSAAPPPPVCSAPPANGPPSPRPARRCARREESRSAYTRNTKSAGALHMIDAAACIFVPCSCGNCTLSVFYGPCLFNCSWSVFVVLGSPQWFLVCFYCSLLFSVVP